nr:tetratricopeptide repeat protein [Synergistaceae bacterium]
MKHSEHRRKGFSEIGIITTILLFLVPGGKFFVTVPTAMEEFIEGDKMEEMEEVFREQSLELDEYVRNAALTPPADTAAESTGNLLKGLPLGLFDSLVLTTEEKALMGDIEAQNELGWMYDTGEGMPENVEEAVKWYRKAAEQGNSVAQANLAWMYEKGRGVPLDLQLAVEWYSKAAEQGLPRAQNNLGVLYEYGTGVPKDEKKAVELYTKAAEQGYVIAQTNLGWMYENGRGVRQN